MKPPKKPSSTLELKIIYPNKHCEIYMPVSTLEHCKKNYIPRYNASNKGTPARK